MMRIQVKLVVLVFLVLAGTVSAVIWKTRDQLVQDKLGFLADSSMKQIAPLKRLTQDRLDEQKSRLIKFASARAALGSGRAKAPAPYDAVALVQFGQSQWSPVWVEKHDAPKADLPAGFELTLLKSLPYARVRDGETFWVRLSDRQGAPLYAILVSVEIQAAPSAAAALPAAGGTLPDSVDYAAQPTGAGRKALVVGISSADPLADLTEEYIGSTNVVYIVDDKGYVASHVNKAYLGALFSEDPIVAEIINTKKTAASGNYQDLESRAVLGHFERIDRTNLYAVITAPLKATQDLASAHVRTALLAAAAVGLLGLFIVWLFGRQIELAAEGAPAVAAGPSPQPPLEKIKSRALIAEPLSAAPVVEAVVPAPPRPLAPAVGAGPSATETLKVGFVNAVKEPLLAILGHAQLVRAKAESEPVTAHAESIEREARRAKDIVDRLMSWSEKASSPQKSEALDLRAIVESTLREQDETLKAEGIYVAKELHAVPKLRGSAEEVKIALLNLIDNAREAMRARPKKHLRVQLELRGDTIVLVVGDSGIGMTRDVKEHAFEPFYKSFDSPDRVGLGLALVQRAVRNLNGQCEIESTVGEGATFTLKLPVAAEDRQLFMSAPIEPLAVPPPPPPRVENGDEADDDDDSEEAQELPATPKANFLASDKDFLDDDDDDNQEAARSDDDDDDEEEFASVPLSRSLVQERLESQPAPPAAPREPADPDGFRVRVRRPRVRS